MCYEVIHRNGITAVTLRGAICYGLLLKNPIPKVKNRQTHGTFPGFEGNCCKIYDKSFFFGTYDVLERWGNGCWIATSYIKCFTKLQKCGVSCNQQPVEHGDDIYMQADNWPMLLFLQCKVHCLLLHVSISNTDSKQDEIIASLLELEKP